jgi:hypothetical protein
MKLLLRGRRAIALLVGSASHTDQEAQTYPSRTQPSSSCSPVSASMAMGALRHDARHLWTLRRSQEMIYIHRQDRQRWLHHRLLVITVSG